MNDRFKFRVWDNRNNGFWSSSDLEKVMLNDEGGLWRFEYDECDRYCATHVDMDDYTVMQCTGLKDSEGRLIYEGDIMKDKIIFEVLYSKEDLTFMVKFNGSDWLIPLSSTEARNCKVVGNIYENKELLSA